MLTISSAAKEGKKLVVVGSSFIGMEIVVSVLKRALASIDVVGRGHVPFEAVLGKDIGTAIQKVRRLSYFPVNYLLLTRSTMNPRG